MIRAKTTGRAGFTLIETLVALTILGAVMGGVFAMLRSSSRAFQVASAGTRLNGLVNETLDRIADRLRASKLSTVTPQQAPPTSSSRIDFQTSTGFVGGAAVWGNTERIVLQNGQVQWIRDLGLASQNMTVLADNVATLLQGEAANGLDDNGNGLVDESGLCFAFNGTSVVVRLSLRGRSSVGSSLVHTAEQRVFFRNR